ncbi:putative Ig domain-containing protein [Roseisolibacter sp. H3M3-2]|uniref:putative Ig domain-containing protein n=1 Tax=Roseisolibacter sp. H3M3-2 TaxID=3031323 RepID=UPI0023D97D55|nr:putative Ig domain-containing protein [Roseisolibacter sp. H3M3-2]MDF1504436.1 putative Ig domain-containing protein [Roseisolibacter sp. H3M3-2]
MKHLVRLPLAALLLVAACGDGSPTAVETASPIAFTPRGPNFDLISSGVAIVAGVKTMSLAAGGANGATTLTVTPQNDDGKNGCNLTGDKTLVVTVVSSNPAVATVSPSSVTFNSCGATPSLTVTPKAVGSTSISLTQFSNSTEGSFDLAPATFTVNVTASNTAPVLDAIGPKSVLEGQKLSFSATGDAKDAGQTLTYSLVGASNGATIDPTSGLFEWTAGDGTSTSTASFTVRVSDGVDTDEETFTATVTNVAPTATFTAPTSIKQGESIALAFSAPIDVEADKPGLTYAFDCGTGYGSFGASATASCPTSGTTTRTVKGKVRDKDDGVSEYTKSVEITPNNRPTLNAIGAKAVLEATQLKFTASGNANDLGQSLTFSLVGAPAGAAINPTTGEFTWTPADGPSQSTKLTVKVSDGFDFAQEEIEVTVNNVNPTATLSVPATTVSEGTPVSLTLSNAVDVAADEPTLKFAVDCGSGYGALATSGSFTCPTADNGSLVVKAKVQDKDGGLTEYPATVTVTNVAPTATFNAPAAVNEGAAIVLSLTSPQDVPADLPGLTYSFDCGNGIGYAAAGGASTASCPTTDNGSRTVKGKVIDKDGGVTEYTATVTINNVNPTATFSAPSTVTEGTAIQLSLSNPQDAAGDLPTLQYAFDCGSGYGAASGTHTASCATTDNGTRPVKGKIIDKDGGSTEYSSSVAITNVDPAISALSIPSAPIAAGQTVTVTASFTDPGTADTHTGSTIVWDIDALAGSDFATPKTVTSVSGGVATFARSLPAGVYTVRVTVLDDDGGSDVETAAGYIVVFDPTGGFVTGGGWVDSPVNAMPDNPTAFGKANFGFNAKYQRGANVPTGNTEFQFHAGALDFKSTDFQWLVVAGARAQFKGTGTIKGRSGSFQFLLTAVDAAVGGGGSVDKFRIKITGPNDVLVYDNGLGAPDDSDSGSALKGGNISIKP